MLGQCWMKVWAVTVLGLASLLAQAGEGRFRAVVAVATQYSPTLSPQPGLAKAAPQVELALRALAKKAGYAADRVDIRILTDSLDDRPRFGRSTADEINVAVWNAARETTSVEDTLVFYFTGHGSSDGATPLLYASGADGHRPYARINLRSDIYSPAWKESPAGVKLIIVDACQTSEQRVMTIGPVLAYGARQTIARANGPARAGGQGTAVLMAANEGQRAWVDQTVGFGLFTRYLVEELIQGEHMTAQQLVASIRERVLAGGSLRSEQFEVQEPILDVLGSPGGEYVLTAQSTPRTRDRARDAQTLAATRALRQTLSGLSAPLAVAINVVNGEKGLPARPSDLLKFRDPKARQALVNIDDVTENFRSSFPGPLSRRPDPGTFLCQQTAMGIQSLRAAFVEQSMLGYDIAELASEVAADRTAISFMQRSPCGARQTGEPLNKVLPSEETRQYVEKLIALQDRLMEIERIVSAP